MDGSVEPRISDADRNVAVARLENAYGEGRLTLEEFEERVDLAHHARVRSELEVVVQDLPGPDTPARSRESRDAVIEPTPELPPWLRGAGPLLLAPLVCTAIYAMTSFGEYFWPMWVWFGCLVPLVAGLLRRL